MAMPTRNNPAKMTLLIIWGLLALVEPGSSSESSSDGSSLSATPSPTSKTSSTTQTVSVGVDGFKFTPPTLTANVGDIISFEFFPQNHSVARAEYGIPCIPYENTGVNKTGFWSGFHPVSNVSGNLPTWQLRINDTEPIFFYCAAPDACIPDGMIGAINPTETESLENQALFVKNSSLQLYPGQQTPPESSPTGSSSPSSISASSAAPASNSTSSSNLSGGAIAGIVIGAVAVIALAGFAFYLCGRNRTLASVLRYSHPPQRPSNVPQIPYSPSPNAPYSPEFSPKPGLSPSPRPVLGPHDSWQTESTAQPLRSGTPEMTTAGGMMPPNNFVPGHGNGGYSAVENPGNVAGNRQPSPGEAPWSPGGFSQTQYAQVPENHEMATGQEVLSPGLSSLGTYQDGSSYIPHEPQQLPVNEGPHELDARSAVPDTPGAAPPQYAARAFSFSEGGEAPPGVEKVLRD